MPVALKVCALYMFATLLFAGGAQAQAMQSSV
jgi:hypothetical protein